MNANQLMSLLKAAETDHDKFQYEVFIELPDGDYDVASVKVDYAEGIVVLAVAVEEDDTDDTEDEEQQELELSPTCDIDSTHTSSTTVKTL